MALLHLSYLCLLLLFHSNVISAGTALKVCEGRNYTDNSTYQLNLGRVLSYFSSLNSTFSTHTEGSEPDSVYGLILCRGDLNISDCQACFQSAALDVLTLCPKSKQATLWYDNCQLRYSDFRFFSSIGDAKPSWKLYNTRNDTAYAGSFVQLQKELLDKIMYAAAYNSPLMFATGTAVNGSDVELNALVQCTRDISDKNCSLCLSRLRDDYKGLEGKMGGQVLGKNCKFRYDEYSFFQGKPTVLLNLTAPALSPPLPSRAPSPSAPSLEDGSKDDTKNVLIIVIPIVAALSLLTGICIFMWKKKATKRTLSMPDLKGITSVESLSFDLLTLKVATRNFLELNKLGEGGFGSVYKGKLSDGQEIAVKRLSASSAQGIEELKNELLLVAKLQHRNLVKLLGVCLEEEEKLLVYEYLPNRSLDHLLFDHNKCKLLDWGIRFNIIDGIARGLCYLHEESQLKVVHRDLKASNILLDADMNSKISDFGLARLFDGDETQSTTSQVVGTFGYMAPEYALHGHFSTKVDIFSYGILVLEILTGRKGSSFYDSERSKDFLNYIWDHWTDGTISEAIDPSLGNSSKNEVWRCFHIALLCVQEDPAERPQMSSVVLMLHNQLTLLQAPQPPRFLDVKANCHIYQMPSDERENRPSPVSVNHVSITELQPR